MQSKDPRSKKKTYGLNVFFALWGSMLIIAARNELVKSTPGGNFTDIYEQLFCSFSLLTVWFCDFLSKEYYKKVAHKMLVKLILCKTCSQFFASPGSPSTQTHIIIFQSTCPCVNFINVLRTAFTLTDPKIVNKIDNLTVFFTLLGSECVKAVRRTLMKLSPDRKLTIRIRKHNLTFI